MTGDIHAYLHLRMLTKHFIGHIIKIFKTNIKWTNKKFIKEKHAKSYMHTKLTQNIKEGERRRKKHTENSREYNSLQKTNARRKKKIPPQPQHAMKAINLGT